MTRVFTNSVGTRVKGAQTELNLVGNTTETGTINLYELSGNGKEHISLKAPDSLAEDYTLTFPSIIGISECSSSKGSITSPRYISTCSGAVPTYLIGSRISSLCDKST